MKIVFISNFYNHHQSQLSNYLYKMTGGEYHFVATSAVPTERRALGYQNEIPEFAIEYQKNRAEAIKAINDADVIIIGSAPEQLIEKSKRDGKLIFRYSERPLKKGFEIWKYPYRFIRWHKLNPGKAKIYMLCASAYTKRDYSKFGMYFGKCFKWGYFPEYKKQTDSLFEKKNTNEILWCGRFLDWKHPDDALKAAKLLAENGFSFHMNIIGIGGMGDALKESADSLGISDNVSFLGSMPPDNVREYMEKAGIFLFTSDKKEGWGAVLNEAMNSGCAVVASKDAGSTPYLVRDGINGMVYKSCDVKALYDKLAFLLGNKDKQTKLGKKAYETIANEWNAEIAARRLIDISKIILENGKVDGQFESGPMSRA